MAAAAAAEVVSRKINGVEVVSFVLSEENMEKREKNKEKTWFLRLAIPSELVFDPV